MVGCDLLNVDAIPGGDILGQYEIGITICYQNEYLEGLGYAAVSRARKAVISVLREKGNRLAYAGGDLEIHALELESLNKGEGDRTVVAKIVYTVKANAA